MEGGRKQRQYRETGTESEDLSGCQSEEDQRRAEAKTETTHQPDETTRDLTSCTTTAKQVRIKLFFGFKGNILEALLETV